MDKYQVYVPKLVSTREALVSGHRACQGCAEALAVRYVLKALGRNVVIANATGCMEIISTPFPAQPGKSRGSMWPSRMRRLSLPAWKPG